jgi:hypothetical protein
MINGIVSGAVKSDMQKPKRQPKKTPKNPMICFSYICFFFSYPTTKLVLESIKLKIKLI